MSSSPTDRSGLGAVSLGYMVVVCEAFERNTAQRAAEVLEAHGIPALLQSSDNGLPNIPTPPPQRDGSIFIVVPSTLETQAIGLLREHRRRKDVGAESRPGKALQWSKRWTDPQAEEPPPSLTSISDGVDDEDEQSNLQLAEGLPDPGPTLPRLVYALSAIAFGIAFQIICEGLMGTDVFRRSFAASTAHPEQWQKLITAGFVHFSFAHHFYNAVFGLVLGVVLFGSHRIGATMATWLAASMLGLLAQLSTPDTILVAGASAGNYGLIGLWAKGQLERSSLSLLPRRERLRTLGVLVLLVPGALTPVSSTGSNVAVLAHVVGFVTGFLMGTIFHRRLGQAPNEELEQRAKYGMIVSSAIVLLGFLTSLPAVWS